MDRRARRRRCRTSRPTPGRSCSSATTHPINSTELVERLRDEQSVLIVPGDHFEMDGYLRIGFGSDPANLTAGLQKIGTVLDSLPVAAASDAR